MATPPSTLPSELIRLIVDSGALNEADLSSVAQASRLLREEGQRVLFRNPGVIIVRSEQERGRTNMFFDSIILSPHRLALMVRTYTQTTDSREDSTHTGRNMTPSQGQEEIYRKMTEALKLMVNLTAFHSHHVGRLDEYTTPWMVDCIRQCKFRLKEFSWRHKGEEARLLYEFLAFQDDIESLYFLPGFGIGGVSDAHNASLQRLLVAGQKACPKLVTLCGPLSASRVFLPGKQCVKFVDWTWGIDIIESLIDTQSYIAHVGAALHSVQFLEYDSSNVTGPPFGHIAPYLLNLIVLVVSNDRLQEVSEHSYYLPALRAIHFFNEGFWSISAPEELERDHTCVASIFMRCKKLKFVDVDRYMDRSPPHGGDYAYGLTSRRFQLSPETGGVIVKRVNKWEDDWWKDQVRFVAELSADI